MIWKTYGRAALLLARMSTLACAAGFWLALAAGSLGASEDVD